jgi:serine/alanine adding enzyme
VALAVRACTASDAHAWDSFVSSHPAGTYCHAFEWADVIERAYRLRCLRLRLEAPNGQWQGIFPVLVHRSYPMGPLRGTSLGFCNYGDILADASLDSDFARAMCLQYCQQQGLRAVEVRSLSPKRGMSGEVTMLLDLSASLTELWQSIGAKARNQVRKAEKLGLEPRWGRDQVDVLYSIYAANMGRLGTPVHSARFFSAIVSEFGELCDILTVGRDSTPMGAMLVMKYAATWADPFASTLSRYNDHNPSMLMYWEALRTATESGARRFDFGRSHVDSGTFRFKQQWGAQPYPLNYRTFVGGRALDGSAVTAYRGGNAQMAGRVWRYLPAVIQRSLGPSVRRWMP